MKQSRKISSAEGENVARRFKSIANNKNMCNGCLYLVTRSEQTMLEHCFEHLEKQDESCGLETPILIFEVRS